MQLQRFADTPGIHCNAQMTSAMTARFARPDSEAMQMLERVMSLYDMSARAYDRILKVARTIADLDGAPVIGPSHISEATGYRTLDRASWGFAL